MADEAEQALMANGNPFQIFQRNGVLVRPVQSKHRAADRGDEKRWTSTWRLIPVSEPWLCDVLTRCADFVRYDVRTKTWTPKDCPHRVAEMLLSRVGEWSIPNLLGVTTSPFLRQDGSICQTPGYDPDSEILYRPGDQDFPEVKANRPKDEAAEALATLDAVIGRSPSSRRSTGQWC